MNACDDGSNPLGECCDVPARSGVASVLAAADRIATPAQAIAEIRELLADPTLIHVIARHRITDILDRHGL